MVEATPAHDVLDGLGGATNPDRSTTGDFTGSFTIQWRIDEGVSQGRIIGFKHRLSAHSSLSLTLPELAGLMPIVVSFCSTVSPDCAIVRIGGPSGESASVWISVRVTGRINHRDGSTGRIKGFRRVQVSTGRAWRL